MDILSLFNGAPDMSTSDTASLTPWTFQLSAPVLFDKRPFPRPKHSPLVSLVMRILRSYPSMMLRKAALPPFIHPLLFSWAEAGIGPSHEVGPQQLPLRVRALNCPICEEKRVPAVVTATEDHDGVV